LKQRGESGFPKLLFSQKTLKRTWIPQKTFRAFLLVSLYFQVKNIYIKMVKVTVCGAAGGIGQPLSLLLKQSELITHLSLYDIVNTPGVAADLR
jgi:hypothetical protein